jgi:uncharacterized alkaline shock family protein YloU
LLQTLKTEYGTINLDKAVIGKIILEAIDDFKGKVIISNHKGKVSRYGASEDSSSFEIDLDGKVLNIRFFIIIKFGTSIKKVSNQLIQSIKKDINEMLGIETTNITIVVTGISSKQIVRRNIIING